jgi:hypothetical protein
MMSRPANAKTPEQHARTIRAVAWLGLRVQAVAIVSSLGTPLTPTIATTDHVS